MFTINLTPTFMPYGEGQAHNVSRPFPSGVEVNFRLGIAKVPEEVRLTTRIQNSNDLIRLFMATDAIKRIGAKKIVVFISCFPYARQDRVCNPGEAFSLRVIADIVNAQNYERVIMFDPHSDVTAAVINNADVVTSIAFAQKVLEGRTNYVPLSPDAGAEKKVRAILKVINYIDRPALCSKYRVAGGTIEDVEISIKDFGGKDVFIFDDICDGGATYLKLAEEIRKRSAGKIFLVISHGIFSAGLEKLRLGGIDHIFTTDSFQDYDPLNCDFVTEVKLCTIL